MASKPFNDRATSHSYFWRLINNRNRTVEVAFAPLALAAVGTHVYTHTGSVTLAMAPLAIEIAASASSLFQGVADVAIAPLTISGTLSASSIAVDGEATFAVAPITFDVIANEVFTSTATMAAAPLAISVAASEVFTGTSTFAVAPATIAVSASMTLWDANFANYPLSDGSNDTTISSSLSANEITFSRDSAATVQVSATTVVNVGHGYPRVGNAGYGRGLVIEPERTNLTPRSNAQTTSPWSLVGIYSGGSENTAVAPDGTTTADSLLENTANTVHTNTAGTAESAAGSTPYTTSNWIKKSTRRYAGIRCSTSTGFEMTVDLENKTRTASSGIISGTYIEGTANDWCHPMFTCVPVAGAFGFQTFLEDAGGIYGSYTGTTSEVWVWGYQVEAGRYATELIPTTGSIDTRAAEAISITGSNALATNGTYNRIGFEMKFIPKLGSGSLVEDNGTLWYHASGDYAMIEAVTNNVLVSINGSTYISNAGINFTRGDVVEIWIAAGANTDTVVKYRINNGSVTTMTPTAPTTHTPIWYTGDVYLLSYSDSTNMLSSWLQRVAFYNYADTPAWAA